jgi:hypothetical protein
MRRVHLPPIIALSIVSLLGCNESPTSALRRDAGVDTGDADLVTKDTSPGVDAPRLDGAPGDGGCGYKNTGRVLTVAKNIELCMPQTVCTTETCPPGLGDCKAGTCVFKAGYKGVETLPEAWATHYCDLSQGGCHGVTQIAFPEVNAAAIAKGLGLPICSAASSATKCVGIAASSPMVVGNSQEARDPTTGKLVSLWGLGYVEASGLCYELHGPGGVVVAALTDRCGGYCSCKGSGFQECGPCVNATDMAPNCACVGVVPGLYSQCCGRGCPTTKADCDWCASNNHPHFDLDTVAFNRLCGAQAINGSCRINKVSFFRCLAPSPSWPPGGGGCKQGSFYCTAPTPNQVQVPGTTCCCNWNLKPQADGSCK